MYRIASDKVNSPLSFGVIRENTPSTNISATSSMKLSTVVISELTKNPFNSDLLIVPPPSLSYTLHKKAVLATGVPCSKLAIARI